MKKMRMGIVLLLSLTMLLLSACASDSGDMTTFERVQDQGYVRVGFANEHPYAYKTADGVLTGEAVEVARAILSNLGIEDMRGELTEFASLIPGLKAGRYDLITAGMSITPDRAEEVAFANPEYSIGVTIGVKSGNPLGLYSYEDIRDHETATVAVPGGAIEYNYLIEVGVDEDKIVTVPDMPSALAALQSGRVDAISATRPSVQVTLETADDSNLDLVEDFQEPIINGQVAREYGASVFRQEDQDFVEAFNMELEKLKESGQLLEIIQEFGFTEEELPGDMTLEELLS